MSFKQGDNVYINHITNLSPLDKLMVYNSYVATQLSLKHNNTIEFKEAVYNRVKDGCLTGVNEQGFKWYKQLYKDVLVSPFRIVKNNYNSDISIIPFEDWCSVSNVKRNDHGKDWNANGWAQQVTTQMNGIYDWFWRHKETLDERLYI